MTVGPDGQGHVSTVVFDMTGVITRSPLDAIKAYVGDAGARPQTVLRHFRSEAFRQVLLGALPMQALVRDIIDDAARVDGVSLSPDLLLEAMRTGQQIEPDIARLISRLKPRYRLAVLTNNTSDVLVPRQDGSPAWWVDEGPQELGPRDFDLVMSSSELGLVKPDVEIYRELLRRIEADADQVVYIDDQASNLPPAESLGIHTIHYRNAVQCERELSLIGVTPLRTWDTCSLQSPPT